MISSVRQSLMHGWCLVHVLIRRFFVKELALHDVPPALSARSPVSKC